MKIGRNDPCHCGSGNKYKKCCSSKDDAERSAELAARAAEIAAAQEAERAELEEAEPQASTAKAGSGRGAAVPGPRPKTPNHRGLPKTRRRAV
jgi:hypothetical protein